MHKARLKSAAVKLTAGLSVLFFALQPLQARRLVIDNDTYEVYGDASDGAIVNLAYPVNYGSGFQSQVTLGLYDGFILPSTSSTVGMTFTGAPSDYLFADLMNVADRSGAPSVFLSNEERGAIANNPPNTVSNFLFAIGYPSTSVPFGGTPENPLYVYVPYIGTAQFQFIDLSATGTAGDFGLNLTCSMACQNIGFNLAGLSFSQATFNALTAPAELTSFSIGESGSSFNFAFRNATTPVPEPGTWAMMLLGFGAIGMTVRRNRKSKHQTAAA